MMKNITIVQANDAQHLLALYNPDDVREYGITASGLIEQVETFNAMGASRLFIGQLMHGFIMPFFKKHTKNQYANYKPASVNFKQLPDDMVLLIVQFCKNDVSCDMDCPHCQKNPQMLLEDAANNYIEEYLKEKDMSYDTYQETCVLKTDSLDDTLRACKILPIDKCIGGDIIRYDSKYYMSFSFYDKYWNEIKWNVAALSEFGDWENPIRHGFLLEHGTLISDKLRDICKSELVY